MASLEAARQEWQLARKHYQKILRDWSILPLHDRHQHLWAANDRRQAAFARYMKILAAT